MRIARAAAVAAGVVLRERWKGPAAGVSTKSSTSDLVSDADRAAEAAVVAAIGDARPDDEILAEEGSGGTGSSGLRWLVDPLDGTTNYLYGIPHWSVSIACADPAGTLCGVVYDPLRDELFYAMRGGGAWLERAVSRAGGTPLASADASATPIRASAAAEVGVVLLATGFSYVAEERREQARRETWILERVRDVRRSGSAALDLAWTAAGRYDAYTEAFANVWDWAAGILIVSEAGGLVSRVTGVRDGVDGIVASGAAVHQELVTLVQSSATTAERT